MNKAISSDLKIIDIFPTIQPGGTVKWTDPISWKKYDEGDLLYIKNVKVKESFFYNRRPPKVLTVYALPLEEFIICHRNFCSHMCIYGSGYFEHLDFPAWNGIIPTFVYKYDRFIYDGYDFYKNVCFCRYDYPDSQLCLKWVKTILPPEIESYIRCLYDNSR